MTCLSLPAYIAFILMMSASEGQTSQKQTIPELWKHEHNAVPCGDSPVPGRRPANWDCVILARRQFSSLPPDAVVLRIESFATKAAAEPAATPASIVVEAAGKIWLLTFARKGERSQGGEFVTEIGPLPIPSAPAYEMVVAEADLGPDINAFRFNISILDRRSGTCSRVSSAWNCRIGSCALEPERVRSRPGTLQ
jgi:hypothetical protein